MARRFCPQDDKPKPGKSPPRKLQGDSTRREACVKMVAVHVAGPPLAPSHCQFSSCWPLFARCAGPLRIVRTVRWFSPADAILLSLFRGAAQAGPQQARPKAGRRPGRLRRLRRRAVRVAPQKSPPRVGYFFGFFLVPGHRDCRVSTGPVTFSSPLSHRRPVPESVSGGFSTLLDSALIGTAFACHVLVSGARPEMGSCDPGRGVRGWNSR